MLRVEDILEVLVRIERAVGEESLRASVGFIFDTVLPAIVLCYWCHLLHFGWCLLVVNEGYVRWATSRDFFAWVQINSCLRRVLVQSFILHFSFLDLDRLIVFFSRYQTRKFLDLTSSSRYTITSLTFFILRHISFCILLSFLMIWMVGW